MTIHYFRLRELITDSLYPNSKIRRLLEFQHVRGGITYPEYAQLSLLLDKREEPNLNEIER